tara:strand:+ start:1770 stop:1925 length:156 start_codon:yes stop_codon:yes gene_type:complete
MPVNHSVNHTDKQLKLCAFGSACCYGYCLTIFVFEIAAVRMTVFVSGFAIF